MTQEEAIASLIDGSQGHNAEFVTVKRVVLLLALGHDQPAEDPHVGTDQPADDVS